jgi:hypothetical protein
MNDEAITEEDSIPLYKTAFVDTNRVCVIFEVGTEERIDDRVLVS